MPEVKKNFDEIIRRYCDEVRSWTRSWLEENMGKELPVWDESGHLLSETNDVFNIWAPKETMMEFAQEIAHEHIIPLIIEDMENKGNRGDWEDILLPSEDSSLDYIFPIFMKTFRDEAYKYLEKMHTVIREIDRDLLGYPKGNFAASRIFAAITEEIEEELAEDRLIKDVVAKNSKPKKKTKSKTTKKKQTKAKRTVSKSKKK